MRCPLVADKSIQDAILISSSLRLNILLFVNAKVSAYRFRTGFDTVYWNPTRSSYRCEEFTNECEPEYRLLAISFDVVCDAVSNRPVPSVSKPKLFACIRFIELDVGHTWQRCSLIPLYCNFREKQTMSHARNVQNSMEQSWIPYRINPGVIISATYRQTTNFSTDVNIRLSS